MSNPWTEYDRLLMEEKRRIGWRRAMKALKKRGLEPLEVRDHCDPLTCAWYGAYESPIHPTGSYYAGTDGVDGSWQIWGWDGPEDGWEFSGRVRSVWRAGEEATP